MPYLEEILVNLGYILMLLALAVRDMLMLRSILMSGQMLIVIYSLIVGNNAVAFYNSLFFSINTFQVIRLIKERKAIHLSNDLEELYASIFSSMTRREFLLFWNMGSTRESKDSLIIRRGERCNRLYLILSGTVDVIKDRKIIAKLTRGKFIAEMSFLTNETASADTLARGDVKHISWNQDKLRHLDQLNPELLIKIQNILGKDLVEKIKAVSENGNHE